jgi:DNA polymerase (family 10)
MDNQDIARLYELTATLLEIKGENAFKIKTYLKNAEIIRSLPDELENLIHNPAELQKQGLTKNQIENIEQILKKGFFSVLEQLKQEVPEGVLEMSQLSGLGPKKLKFLWKEANITTINELEENCKNGKILTYKGFGPKTKDALLTEIQQYYKNRENIRLDRALRAGKEVIELLSQLKCILRCAIGGEVRRYLPIIKSVVIIAEYTDLNEAQTKLISLGFLQENENAFTYTTKEKIKVLVRLSREYISDLFTSSTYGEHLQKMLPFLHPKLQTEEEIYQNANLPYIPPELRENKGELELAQAGKEAIEKLLQPSDIKGILHAHSTYSDGAHSLKAMALACQKLGYQYLGITDHSQSASYANGLTAERLKQQWREIDELNQELAPFCILKGIESDILPNGELDYPNETLAQFDFVIISVHSQLKMDEKTATERILKAISNPYASILGHPTGRLLLKRNGYPLDMPTVIEACSHYRVAIEINCDPHRLDLDWEWLPYALEKGVKIALCPDSHSINDLENINYGVMLGRKGFLTAQQTLNTLTANQLITYFQNKK